MNKPSNKFSILPIFFIVLIDMIGIGLVIPILAPLLINPSNSILASSTSFATRTIILGLLLASYPLAQFFGAPILGALSDRYGRKKLLLVSLAGTLAGYILFAIAIINNQLWLLFVSRIIDGFTGGNITIVLSAIADISSPQEKVKRFGLIGMAFGLGVIIGPFIGGKLADSSIVSWFNYATPFWFAAILCFVNIIVLIINFKETLQIKKHSDISILTGFRHVKKAFSFLELRVLFIFVFMFTLGFSFYTQFFQVFLIEKFSYSESQIGTFFAFLGLCIALTQGLIVRPLAKKFCPEQIIPFTVLLLSIVIFLMLFPSKDSGIYFIAPFIAIFSGLTMPNNNALISNLTAPENQGEVLGINQSLQSLGLAIPALIAGFFSGIHYTLPIILSSMSLFIAWGIFMLFFRKQHKKPCHLNIKT
ncbi:MAG: tetracycline resistance MFS efflux pump [Candidatus Woesearchaeota archaeon]|nr:MAG: tetracycline resistance MFS efflux pump [Candidatus Woesearchaeota archaeon]